jgi:hypothetical protein
MKFDTSEDQDLLKRLTYNPDFKQYLGKLEEDFEKALNDLLLSPGHQDVEVKRGISRSLYQQLKALRGKK